MHKSRFPCAANMHVVCNTCAAAGRDLQKLVQTPEYLSICNGLDLSPEDMVCFECIARLRGFSRFRRRALQVRAALWNITNNRDCLDETYVVPCVSTLTQTVISPNDVIYYNSEARLYDWSNVKQEIDLHGQMPDAEVTESTTAPNMRRPKVEVKVEVDYKLPNAQLQVSKRHVTFKTQSGLSEDVKVSKDDSETDTASETSELESKSQLQFEPYYKEITVGASEVREHLAAVRSSLQFKNAPYKCSPCARIIHKKKQFIQHRQRHSAKQGSFKCSVCQQRFASLDLQEKHTLKHFIWYKCLRCDKVRASYNKIRAHFYFKHDEKPRYCTVCDARFTSVEELTRHKNTHLRQRHVCDICDMTYTYAFLLQRHKLMSHTKVAQLECSICHKKYKGELNLDKHMRREHDSKPKDKAPDENAYCAECDVQYKNIYCYRIHLKTTKHRTPAELNKFECDHCGNKYNTKSGLQHHIVTMHLEKKLYPCDLCTESFYSANRRYMHKQRDHGCYGPRKTHHCTACIKTFRNRKSLEQHMNVHLGLRPFQCKLCDATFAYSAALYTHNRLVHLKRKVGKSNATRVCTETEPWHNI